MGKKSNVFCSRCKNNVGNKESFYLQCFQRENRENRENYFLCNKCLKDFVIFMEGKLV